MNHTSWKSPCLLSRSGSFWLRLVGLLLPALTLTVGCSALNSLHPHDKTPDKIDRPPVESPPDAPAEEPARLPHRFSFRIAPYVFLSDFELPRTQPLFAELAALRDQVQKELLLPPGTAVVQVYLFESEALYKSYMKSRYPDLPSRRAFFVVQPRSMGGEDLNIYTWWGDRIRQDLRHELTHALLHSVIKDVPLWLDEGLAEYFELPPAQHGVNSSHVEVLCRGVKSGATQLNLARLESLKDVDQMNPGEYRESWAWVHLMLRTRPEAKTVLLSYLQQLRGTRSPGQLGPSLLRVYPDLEETLAQHLERLQNGLPRTTARGTAKRDEK
jgi:hypothetical protein